MGEFPLVNSRNLRSSGLVVDSFHHRGETIKLVNQGLSDPVKACSDELIAAVSMLLTIEVRLAIWRRDVVLTEQIASGNPDHLKIHLAGLRQMVALRNSFTDVQPDIRFQVSWLVFPPRLTYLGLLTPCRTDIRVACMTLTKPIFPAVRYARTPHLTIAPPTKELAVAASRLFSMMDTPGVLSTTMSRTISDLRELVWYAEWVKSNHQYQLFDQSTEEYFNTEVLYVEYCLHADRYNEYGEPKSDATIEGCIRLACLLFHNTFIWDFYPQVAPVLPKPILALRAALHATIGLGVFEPCQDLLIWLLFVGASSSGILLRDRAFFMRELAVAVGKRRIQSWHQLRDTLIPFFYVDRCYLTLLHDIWNELLTIPV